MDTSYLHWIFEGCVGVIMYLMKMAHNDLKDQVKKNEASVDKLREDKMAKEDFRDFKQELWQRFDKLEKSMESLREKD